MLKSLHVRFSQGKQFIRDVRKADPKGFRGLLKVHSKSCEVSCQKCIDVCPTWAISPNPITVDLGKCIFCEECTKICPVAKIHSTNEYRISASQRSSLLITSDRDRVVVEASKRLTSIFGRSVRFRSVSSGGCNACELEISAMANVNFDISRFGMEFVASPRHADGLVLSGPLTKNMKEALDLAYEGMPDPKFIIAVGSCAISGGLYSSSKVIDRSFLERFTPDLFVPGCPPHPLSIVNGILDLLGKR